MISVRIRTLLLFLFALSTPVAAQGRVIVLGFDGADARKTQELMDAGQLPNLSKLAEEGTFAPLVSTNPAESAAGWAALNTGRNPVENGVPSFIMRSFQDGRVAVGQGHVDTEVQSVEEQPEGSLLHRENTVKPSGLLGQLAGRSQAELWGLAGGVVFLAFFILFGLLLRMNKAVAFVLAAGLGGAAAWAAGEARKNVPLEIPNVYVNKVEAKGFWDYAAEAGKKSLVLDAALAFGRPETPGAKVLSGLGLPDIRGAGNGNWFVYTTDPFEYNDPPVGRSAKKGGSGTGTVFSVEEREGVITTDVYGPIDIQRLGDLRKQYAELEDQLQNDPDLGWKESGELTTRQDELKKELAALGFKPDGSPDYSDSEGVAKNRLSLPMTITRKEGGVELTIAGQTQTVGVGEWSAEWFRLPFEVNPLVQANAITRARLNVLDEKIEVYLHTFDIDPSDPPFWQPVSTPASFSAELADWSGGPFETLGWSCMTNQLKDKAMSPQLFLEDIEFTMGWRQRLTNTVLERDDWSLLFSVYSTTDRVQHMMYRFADPLHPIYDEEAAATPHSFFGEDVTWGGTIDAIYRQMDARVGEALERLRPEDTLILCADHGFTSFRRQFDINNWLVENGYMTLKAGISKNSYGSPDSYIDWSRTQAYALGLGMVFVNMRGREPNGIVEPSEARALLERLQADLLTATDAGPEDAPYDTPARAVADAQIMWDVYPGPHETEAYEVADLMVGCAEFYRISWRAVGGGIRLVEDGGGVVAGPSFRNNTVRWSGDHASNSPGLVTGIFFSNKKLALPEDGVSVLHIAPTVLDQLGVAVPEELDREPLKAQ